MANKQLVIEILSDAKKFTSGLTEAINTISKATEKAEGFAKYTEQLEVMKKELLEVAQQTAQIGKNVRTGGEIVSQEQLNRIDALTSKVESIDKRFDSFRHTFGDMQNKLNGLSTRTLQVQLDKANASLDAFNQKYASLQQTLNIGLGAKLNSYKDIKQITNIGEMKAAYEDALKIFKSFSKETQKDGDNYSKAFTDAAAAVYKYSSALMFLNDIYYKHNSKKDYFSEDDFEKIQNTAFAAEDIIGNKLADNINNNIETGLKNINIKNYFEEIVGQVDSQTLTGTLKNGGIIIPVKLDSNAFSILENEIKKDISALQSRANNNPIKIHYETDTEELSNNIEKYFKELNIKLKNQIKELNTLMEGLVDDTGLKNTEQDFSSMAKLIPEMLRKVAEYSEQLKTITTDTKNSFENINSFTKEENFINYANAIKQTAESFKLLTSSLDDVSSKLSGNGLEGQFDILKKKFSELSIDTLTQEKTKENEQARKTKIKEIKELFALYSTYQSRGGIRPFSDLISGDADANKKAYLQLAYSDYSKNKNKKETSTEAVPFDAKQLKDILQILKDIRETIKNISEIKIDTSELTEAISAIQGNNSEKIFTPQAVSQIWQVLIQYANNYSESLSKVIEKLEIISEKDFEPLKLDSEEFEKTYNQIENIVQLLEKGFGISLNPENQLKENIQDIAEANQTATESNQKLAESMQEVAQAAQEEKEAVIDPTVKDYLVKWIEMVKGTKAYSGMEERAVFLKGGTPASDIGQGKLSYKNGFVQGQSKIRKYKDAEADTLLHSHQYSKDVDNLRFSFADIKQGMSDIAEGVQNGIHKLLLSCGDEILSLDFGNVSKETASDVQENIRQIYTAAWTMFGGHVFSDGTASERGMSDELRNKASVFINTMLRKMLEEMGGSLTSMKLVDGKMIDTTNTRLNQIITPQQQNLFEQIKKIYALSEDEYEGYRGNLLKKIQKDNGIETNVTGLAGLSKTELEEIDKLLLQIFNHKQQLENTKSGTRVEATLKEKIAEAEKRIAEITKKPFPPEKSSTEQKPDIVIKENQTQQQAQQTQQTIQQTNNEIENTDQSIITLVSDIKNALNSLSSDLNILAEIIVSLNNSTEQIDYSSRISNIREGITTLNNSIKELVELVQKLDFDKINNIKISTEPFDKIIESLKEIIDLTERISGVPSKTSLDSQFKDIQKIYSSLVNNKGNFIVTKDKDAVQNLFSQYNKYKKFGGTKSLIDLDESKANANKLSKYYDKYLNNISQQKESETSIINPLKNEAENFIGIKNAADEATVSKESFVKANKKLETQTDKTSKSLEQEKTQFETFINDVKTLVTTDIKSNNVVDFNTQILNSSKETNEVLKEELQYLQKLNEIQKNNPIKQNNIQVVSRSDSSKKQDSKKRISSFEKPDSEFDYEDLGLSYDPYLTAFQEFLLIAAEEAEKVKQQIISVAEFDNRLSEALTALYGQIPDLDDISASTGYGKGFNVTGATVSFRDKTTNDIYRKTFSLKKDKETGNFYIDQTTAILNDAEKYGKDNEKQAQKVLEWQTKLNAWLQNFSNKTSGTLDSTKDFQSLKNFNFTSEKDWINIKTIQQRLEGLYNEIVSNSRRGTSSLSPVPNMMFGQESRLTKMQKANSIYNKMALNWNGENGAEDTEGELKKLSSLYNNLQIEIKKFNEDGSNIELVAQAYGAFNEQLNKVNEQLNRMKIINTEISGNKINNLNNWFKDMPDPSSAEGKIEKYGQVYGQFVEAQQRLNELTTNLNKGTTEESAQKYEEDKEKIHSIILELEELKKILSSDSMNINNQMGKVIKQNIPETDDIEQIKEIVDEYAKAEGVITNSTYSTSIDKEGNQFVKFSREIKNAQGVVSEFEYTYDKAMGTIAVATKKVQEPESAFKTLADELTTKWRGLFTTLASFVGFYRLWGYFKQGVDTVREFDTALTEMQKVSDETISTLQNYQKTTFDTADAIGATVLQIQNSTADFMRLGESLEEASESAKVANVLMNVSEFQSIDEATKSLIAMSAAYDDLSKMNIIDKLNEVGLKIA